MSKHTSTAIINTNQVSKEEWFDFVEERVEIAITDLDPTGLDPVTPTDFSLSTILQNARAVGNFPPLGTHPDGVDEWAQGYAKMYMAEKEDRRETLRLYGPPKYGYFSVDYLPAYIFLMGGGWVWWMALAFTVAVVGFGVWLWWHLRTTPTEREPSFRIHRIGASTYLSTDVGYVGVHPDGEVWYSIQGDEEITYLPAPVTPWAVDELSRKLEVHPLDRHHLHVLLKTA